MRLIKPLLFALLLMPFMVACNKEEGKIIISFDENSTKSIPVSGEVYISGTILATNGLKIDGLSVVCTFEKSVYDLNTGELLRREVQYEVFASKDMPRTVITKVSDSEYRFIITHENSVMSSHYDDIKAVKVNARLEEGNHYEKSWGVKPQFKI